MQPVSGDREQVGSRYVLFERIGAGAMGQVYRAGTRDGGVDLAIKILRPELAGDKLLVRRFLNEWDVLRSLEGPHVVRVLDLVHEGDTLALVMPRVAGGSLRDHLVANGGRLAAGEARDLAVQVLQALAEAHAQEIVHRDVKPENVLLERQGATLLAKVSDFGISAIVRDTTFTRLTSVVGTAQYMAPELLSPGGRATHAVDVYAAGVLLYELVAGRTPFSGEEPLAIMYQAAHEEPPRPGGVDDELWEVLRGMLAKDPAARPAAAEAAERLVALRLAPAAGNAASTIVRPLERRDPARPDPFATRHAGVPRPRDAGEPPSDAVPDEPPAAEPEPAVVAPEEEPVDEEPEPGGPQPDPEPIEEARPEPAPVDEEIPRDPAGSREFLALLWRRWPLAFAAVALAGGAAALAGVLATRPSGTPATTTTVPAGSSTRVTTTLAPTTSSTTGTTVPAGPRWRGAMSVAAGVAWVSVSCTGASFCVASGSRAAGAGMTGTDAVAAVYRDGTWSALHLIDAQAGQTQGVACATASACVAIDPPWNVVTFDGRAWSGAIRLDGTPSSLISLSCPSATFCAAADNVGNVSVFDGHAAVGTTDVDNSGPNDNTAISCPTPSFCALIDLEGYFFTYDGRSWTGAARAEVPAKNQNVLAGFGDALSCASATFCVALDEKGDALTFDGRRWSRPVSIDPHATPVAVSCPRTTFCVAVDDTGAAMTLQGPRWSAPRVVAPGEPLSSVDCPTTAFCMAAGDDGTVVSFR